VITLYAVDAWFYDGMYFDAAREMSGHWRQHF
jgi:hypothetical protein